MTLEALFNNPNALPSAPKVVEQLISSFAQEDVSVEQITRTLSTDPVLSAKLLKLANSAYYHVARSIGTIDDAVRMLGFVTVRTLVVSSGLVSGFKTVPGVDLKRFWRYSLRTAVAAKWLAKLARENTEVAFTIGMMHALGQLVMHAGETARTLALDERAGQYDAKRLEHEMDEFGYDYSGVGAELALRWKFPDIFPDTIHDFPDPTRQSPLNRMAVIIYLAVWRAQAEEAGLNAQELAASAPDDVAASIGLAPGTLLAMPSFDDLTAGLEELIH